MKKTRQSATRRRHLRVRKKVVGTAERPRLCVYRSIRHLYVQVVDDNIAGGGSKTLCSGLHKIEGIREFSKKYL